MRVGSWKFPWQQQCLAEPDAKSTGKLVAFWTIARQKYVCIVEADESTRKRMEGTLVMKITSQEHVWIHWVTTSLCARLFQCPKQWKYLMQRLQWKYICKIGENTDMATDESQKLKWGDRWSKEQGQNSTRCIVDGPLSSPEFGIRTTVSKVQRQSRTPRWHCERWFWFVCSVH